MAVNAMSLDSTLIVKYQNGSTPEGSPVLKQKSFNNLKAGTTEQDAYDVAAALFSLGQNPVITVLLRKNFELQDE